ncbi:ABC transporter ATP-binding protein [Pseudaminobacter sp. NGMCC 1.201702]|uniref:ABC transporter ATP-binding protein n=1 Tax=Pseudaminobacter sp. NGMCC 1.201702 TaxID=3391825 RepID=UPI0039F13337
MATVEVSNVSKKYASTWAVSQANLVIPEGSFFSLLGPSGSGKTTLLRLIAGFLRPDSGVIKIGGAVVNDVPPHRRDIGMVFQQYALFPHRTVLDNVAFGLEMRGCGKAERFERARQALEMVQMAGRENAYPKELSGGQQQRVAIARSVAVRPAVWLLDEPLSALDRKLRVEMQSELRSLQRQLGVTTIYVTHDQEEALSMSDAIAIFRDGCIAQQGTARDLYEQPANAFVADFLGSANLLEGIFTKSTAGMCVEIEGVHLPVASNQPFAIGDKIRLAVRPERLEFAELSSAKGWGLPAVVESITYLGSDSRFVLRTRRGTRLVARAASRSHLGSGGLTEGSEINVSWKPEETAIVAQ